MPTATRMASSDLRSFTDVIGGACSPSLEWEEAAAFSLAVSVGVLLTSFRSLWKTVSEIGMSHTFCMCLSLQLGLLSVTAMSNCSLLRSLPYLQYLAVMIRLGWRLGVAAWLQPWPKRLKMPACTRSSLQDGQCEPVSWLDSTACRWAQRWEPMTVSFWGCHRMTLIGDCRCMVKFSARAVVWEWQSSSLAGTDHHVLARVIICLWLVANPLFFSCNILSTALHGRTWSQDIPNLYRLSWSRGRSGVDRRGQSCSQ